MEKIKTKKAGAALKLFLAGTLAMGSLPMISCGDDGNKEVGDRDYGDFAGKPVYVAGNVSDTKANEMLDLLEELYYGISGFNSIEIANFDLKITKIHIMSGSGTNLTAGVLNICVGDSELDMINAFVIILSTNTIHKDGIMVAKYINLKQQVSAQMKKIEAERVKA